MDGSGENSCELQSNPGLKLMKAESLKEGGSAPSVGSRATKADKVPRSNTSFLGRAISRVQKSSVEDTRVPRLKTVKGSIVKRGSIAPPTAEATPVELHAKRLDVVNKRRALRQLVKAVESHQVHDVIYTDYTPPPADGDPRFANAPFKDELDVKTLRYTACQSKIPHHFWKDGYQLRVAQQLRDIEMLTVVTSYNEDGSEFKRTLNGINENLKSWKEKTGDSEIWKKMLVVIVADGRTKVNETTKEYLASLGVYNEEIMFKRLEKVKGAKITMHMFEKTVQMNINDGSPHEPSSGVDNGYYPPMQILFAMKEKNGGKLDSHLWFFNAFAEHLQPKYTVLLDVGTKPRPNAILGLYTRMEREPDVGGCCGEIAVHESERTNMVIATQEYEYKISNVMDKSLESVLGYITVLPGAFSAYRYEAIRGDSADSPLAKYFVSLTSSLKELGVFKGNMFLAEDRILGFEVLVREGNGWYMAYCNDCVAETDVPETLVDLLKQRRRWLNGSFFALLYALLNFAKLYKSKHPFHRKLVLTFEFVYLCFSALLAWFIPANFMVVFLLLVANLEADLFPIILVYLLLVMSQFVAALGATPSEIPTFYNVTSYMFGFTLYLQVGFLVYDSIVDPDLLTTTLFFLILGIPYFCAYLHGSFFSVAVCTPQYYFMLPTLLNTFLIFAFCNTHDLSWGTKGLETSNHGPADDVGSKKGAGDGDDFDEDKKQDDARRLATGKADKEGVQLDFQKFRTTMVLFFVFTNGMLVNIALQFSGGTGFGYLQFLFSLVLIIFGLRFVGSCAYVFGRFKEKLYTSKDKTRQLLIGFGPNNVPPAETKGWRARTVYNAAYGGAPPAENGHQIERTKTIAPHGRTQSVIREADDDPNSIVADFGGISGFKFQT